jgi:hypothetical protein
MTKFKVGDRVRILPNAVDLYVARREVGKTATIISKRDNDFVLRTKDYSGWIVREESIELLPSRTYPRPLQGKFIMPDGTPGVVNVTILGNVTQVVIIVDPQPQYKASDRKRQFFGGLAYCNPKDRFDINTGVKVACKNALFDGGKDWHTKGYRRLIYSAIRKEMVSKG